MTARPITLVLALATIAFVPAAAAQGAGGLYVADGQFGFSAAVGQALADNPVPGRFFVLAVPPATQALLATGSTSGDAGLRERALASGAQFLVCRRDVQSGSVVPAALVPGGAVAWGWPQGPDAPAPDPNNLFPGESASQFPASMELLRRIRSTCSE
jgi:hypothetical protein